VEAGPSPGEASRLGGKIPHLAARLNLVDGGEPLEHSRDKGTGALVTFNRKKPKPSPLKGLLRQAVICRSGFSRD
jgi:hypothetical protein